MEKSAFEQMGGTYCQQAQNMFSQLIKQIAIDNDGGRDFLPPHFYVFSSK